MNKKDIHINIAPLVDVMLVLLIIFMVTAPMIQSSVNLDLPTTGKASHIPNKTVTVCVTPYGAVYVDQTPVSLDKLGSYLKKVASVQDVICFKADKKLHYGKVFEIINQLVDEGYTKISLMAEVK